MKKIMLLAAAICTLQLANAQSEKYTKAMQSNIASLDSLTTPDAWTEKANAFSRIADAEKNQWLPYYYAALSYVMTGTMQMNDQSSGKIEKLDALANKAEESLNKAEALSKDNAEIYCVKKMIANLRLMADPMNRYMTYGPQAAEALAKAKSLNPENPRIYLLEAQDKFFTPEQFGGSKTEAKTLFELSEKKYQSFKPESELHPSWGLSHVKYFLAQIK